MKGRILKKWFGVLTLGLFVVITMFTIFVHTQYVVTSDDPILTYKIQKSSKETPALWYDAFNNNIKNGNFKNKPVAEEMCNAFSLSWLGDDDRYARLNYDAFVKRMQKQMDLIGAQLSVTPVIAGEYISYYLKYRSNKNQALINENSNFDKRLENSLRMFLSSDMKRINRIKDVSFSKQMLSNIEKHFINTGLGKTESPYFSSRFHLEVISPKEGIFRIDFPVTKESFIKFYERPELQIPPKYFYDIFKHNVDVMKLSEVQHSPHFLLSEQSIGRGKTPEEIRPIARVEAEKKYAYDLDFIRAERLVRARYRYVSLSGAEGNPRKKTIYYGYNFSSEFTQDSEFKNIESSAECDVGEYFFSSKPVAFRRPYFIKYPWEKVRKCEPYRQWITCHILQKRNPIFNCDQVSTEEPEMCAQ